MTEQVLMDFEDPGARTAPRGPKKGGKKGRKKGSKKELAGVPRLPNRPAIETSDEMKRGVSTRNRAAANLKVEGYTYQEIADMLEFESAQQAQNAVQAVLASIHGDDDYETLRMVVAARADQQFRHSVQMARAAYLVLEDGTQVPNTDQLKWHGQASIDLMNYAAITGAKAPQKVEITPAEAEMDRIVREIVQRSGHDDIVDAEVIEMSALPAPESIGDDE